MTTIDEQTRTMIDNIPDKTGKSLAAWKKILAAAELEKHGQMVSLLKKEHGVTHGFANLIVHRFRDDGESDEIDLVDAQYEKKPGVKPFYDAVMAKLDGWDGVEVAPKKSYVSLRRNKQFALLQPSTKSRLDVGINLAGVEPTDRLEASGSFNGMVSHRVRVTDISQVDDELIGWLRDAFDQA